MSPELSVFADAYAHAIAAMAGWGFLVTVITFIATAKGRKDASPTGIPVRDYTDQGYRAYRAQANALEATGPFLAAVLAAILVGASPFWVNLLASVFLVARVAMLVVHVWTQNQPARSVCWMVGMLSVLGLIGLAIVGAFS